MANWKLNKSIIGYSVIGYVIGIVIILISLSSWSEYPNKMTTTDYILLIICIPIYAAIIAILQTIIIWFYEGLLSIGEEIGNSVIKTVNKILRR